jgi:hypothetical protein
LCSFVATQVTVAVKGLISVLWRFYSDSLTMDPAHPR